MLKIRNFPGAPPPGPPLGGAWARPPDPPPKTPVRRSHMVRVARRPVFNRTVILLGSPVLQVSVLLNRTQNVLLLIACVLLVLFFRQHLTHFSPLRLTYMLELERKRIRFNRILLVIVKLWWDNWSVISQQGTTVCSQCRLLVVSQSRLMHTARRVCASEW